MRNTISLKFISSKQKEKTSPLRLRTHEPEEEFPQLKSVQLRPKINTMPKLNFQKRSLTLTKVSFNSNKLQLGQSVPPEVKKSQFRSRKMISLPQKKDQLIHLKYRKVDMERFLMADLEVLKKFPEIDMEAFVTKIKKEEFYRKRQSVKKWTNFKYEHLPS